LPFAGTTDPENSKSTPNLVSQGLSSFSAVHLSQYLSKKLGVSVDPQILYQDNPAQAVAHLVGASAHSYIFHCYNIVYFCFDTAYFRNLT
jgi:hypothetical protein